MRTAIIASLTKLVNGWSIKIDAIGERLREERERLGMSQAEMAAAGGVGRSAQLRYEKGEGHPGADYLAAVASRGMDVLYVVTGTRAGAATLEGPRAELLARLDRLGPAPRAAIEVIVEALLTGEPHAMSPELRHQRWDVSPDIDLALWRAVALSIPDNPGIDKTARLTPQQFIDIVNRAYEFAKDEAQKTHSARRRAQTAIERAAHPSIRGGPK